MDDDIPDDNLINQIVNMFCERIVIRKVDERKVRQHGYTCRRA